MDLSHQELRRGDLLIMCSDGLSGSVKKDEIAELAAQYTELPALCSHLIDLANERGGPDNITVVAARFDGDALPVADGTGEVGYFTLDGMEPDTGEHLAPEEDTEALPPARAAVPLAPRLLILGAAIIAILAAMLLLL